MLTSEEIKEALEKAKVYMDELEAENATLQQNFADNERWKAKERLWFTAEAHYKQRIAYMEATLERLNNKVKRLEELLWESV